MITPRMIEEKTMSEAKRKEAKNSVFAFYIGRPISYALTVPLLYTNITPNTVTLISIVFAFAGFFFLSLGQTTGMRLLGLLCIFLWNMGDGIDGNIARYKNIKSANGDLLDTLGGYLAMVLVLLGMGSAAYQDTAGASYLPVIIPILLSGLSAVFALIPRLLMHRKIAGEKAAGNTKAEELKDKEHYGPAKIIALNLCDPAGLQEVIMLVAILGHLCTEFTIAYFLIHTAVMIYSLHGLME